MPLILPHGFDGPPWEICEKFLRKYHEKAKIIFKATRKRKSGFIVAHWEDESSQMPTHYLHRSKFIAPAFISQLDFVRFGDDTVSEDPHQYKTLTAMLRVVEVARRKFGPRFGLVFWRHSESALLADKYYKAMLEGMQFPGGVTQ